MVKKELRELESKEKEMCRKQIEIRHKRNKWLEFQLKYYDLMINEGLEQNFLEKIREFKLQRKEFDKELTSNKEVVKVLNEQIKNGVEVKKEIKQEDTNYID